MGLLRGMDSRNANSKETKYLIEKKGRVINLLSGLDAPEWLGMTQGTKVVPNFLFSFSKSGVGYLLLLYIEGLLPALPEATLGKVSVSYGCTPRLQHEALCNHTAAEVHWNTDCWQRKNWDWNPWVLALWTIPWAIDHFRDRTISLLHIHLTSPSWVTAVPVAGAKVMSFLIKSWETAARTLHIHMHSAIPMVKH